jgi:hypothetical protein
MDLKGQKEEVKKNHVFYLHVPLGGLGGFSDLKNPS